MPRCEPYVHVGDNRKVLPTLKEASFDSVVTDPPYALVEPNSARSSYSSRMAVGRTEEDKKLRSGGFMGKKWDSKLPGIDTWQAVLRVLKPGGYMLCFGGTRTYHRLACAVEDAGFEIRDCLMWIYGSGFPKGKGCLKPAYEPILLCRKPGSKVLPLGIDECRVPTDESTVRDNKAPRFNGDHYANGEVYHPALYQSGSDAGRYPANLAHDGSDEVLEAFAAFGEKTTNPKTQANYGKTSGRVYGDYQHDSGRIYPGDTGTAARFFYCAKASKKDRGSGNNHPCVKPTSLLEWLVKLITPPGGKCLDPFLGSGSTAVACLRTGRRCVGIEENHDYAEIARRRIRKEMESAQT